jgi:hypothetical protein
MFVLYNKLERETWKQKIIFQLILEAKNTSNRKKRMYKTCVIYPLVHVMGELND